MLKLYLGYLNLSENLILRIFVEKLFCLIILLINNFYNTIVTLILMFKLHINWNHPVKA